MRQPNRQSHPPGAGTGSDDFSFRSMGQHVAVFCLLFYKASISPLFPTFCKFHPTCSMYAKEAIERHGVARGLSLTLRRLLRCRPFSPGGIDPVPDA
jgi:putative membrane protein insertion efficiency factor